MNAFWIVRSYSRPNRVLFIIREDGSEVRIEFKKNKKKSWIIKASSMIALYERKRIEMEYWPENKE